MAGTWDYCPKGMVVENLPPDQNSGGGMSISMNGWTFSSKPTVPYQYSFKVTLHGLKWFLQANDLYDNTSSPTVNARRFEEFVKTNGLWDNFVFPHPHLGSINCRFKVLPLIPRAEPNSNGLIPAFEVELVHHDPSY